MSWIDVEDDELMEKKLKVVRAQAGDFLMRCWYEEELVRTGEEGFYILRTWWPQKLTRDKREDKHLGFSIPNIEEIHCVPN